MLLQSVGEDKLSITDHRKPRRDIYANQAALKDGLIKKAKLDGNRL